MFPGEIDAIKTVVALGERYGYGNLIMHLQTAWARHLVKNLGFTEQSARLAAGTPISSAERIKTLEDLLAFDKHSWASHEPSYAAMCLSEQRISLGKFCEYMRRLRDGHKDDPIIQGVTPSTEPDADTAAILLLRTIAAEAERTGSWHVPPDLQERLKAWVAARDGGVR